MRKVYVKVTTKLILTLSDDDSLEDVMSDMEYDFTSNTEGVYVVDTEMLDYVVTDSK